MSALWEAARAKVNLSLHITGRRSDGYHLLESLVVFPEFGDALIAEPAKGLSLSIDGPFGDGLAADADNLVLRAAEALRDAAGIDAGAALHLTKSLPIASGIGGGSADAAAALRCCNRLWGLNWPESRLEKIGIHLGADIPVCVRSGTCLMRGIGEQLSAGPTLPDGYILLINPMRSVETKAVFHARGDVPFSAPRIIPAKFETIPDLAAWLLEHTANDLAEPAQRLVPEIAAVLEALAALDGAFLSRMSGSGATCFALFKDLSAVEAGAQTIRATHPGWWAEFGRFS